MIIQGLVGRKLGMTRVFDKDGISTSITVIEITPHYVTQIKNLKTDGYAAIQVTTGYKRSDHVNKAELGHFEKINKNFGRGLWEFRLTKDDDSISLGDVINIGILENVKKVDITGISKGKGFSGTVKRWNFHMQDASHGNSLSHRAPGSIGQNQTPGRVFKGKKMAGQLGNCQITIQNLDIIDINIKYHLLSVKGAVPGIIGNNLFIKTAVKLKS